MGCLQTGSLKNLSALTKYAALSWWSLGVQLEDYSHFIDLSISLKFKYMTMADIHINISISNFYL